MELAGLNVLDVFIALFVVVVILRGARTGFLAGVFSLVGVVVGVSAGSRIASSLMPEDGTPIYGAGITLGSILAFAVLGEVIARTIGGSIRNRLSSPTSETLDGFGGAVLGFALSLMLVWAVGVFALQSPPLAGLHPAVRDSRILQSLDERMPSGLITRAVADLEPLPQIRGPEPEVSAPEGSIVGDPDVRAASARTLRVGGIACGYGVEGSGWVAGRNLVVTNAHVVAGETATHVQAGGTGRRLPAKVVVFDEKNDIAVLRVNGLGLTPLRLAAPRPGEDVAVIGFPENGPLDIEPARTGTTQRVISSDAYDSGPVERVVTSYRVYVRPGNSGGPAVNEYGRVVSTIFASRTGSDNSGYGIPSRIVHRHLRMAADRTTPVSTEGCAN
ncbi:MAG TPA: MarP family serine protease [Rubrobacter sp.]|jgi:S1-C subfamily serine protease|nr:MarP family serine protease [Rubrobacter sp.]